MTTEPDEENDDATANRWGNGDQPVVRRPRFVDETKDRGLKESYDLAKKQATLFSRTAGELAHHLDRLRDRANNHDATATSQSSPTLRGMSDNG